jgi:ABC-type Fe3+-hydroxamate transport system substrate-binding protein
VPFDFDEPGAGYNWRSYFQDTADRLGLTEQVGEYFDALDERIASLAADIPDGTTLAVLRINNDATFSVYPGFYPADLVRDLGLDPVGTPAAYIPEATPDQCCPGFSAEQLDQLAEVDVLFLADNPNNPDDALDRASSNPLFDNLPATQAGRVFEVSTFAWTSWTPQGVQAALDDIEMLLVPAVSG